MTPKTASHRAEALLQIQLAQTHLNAAAVAACDLRGWGAEWLAISEAADAARALWHRCNDAPLPIGHTGDDTPPRVRRCLDLKSNLKD